MTKCTNGILVIQNLILFVTYSFSGIPMCITSSVLSLDTIQVKTWTKLRQVRNTMVGYNGNLLSRILVQNHIDNITKLYHVINDI